MIIEAMRVRNYKVLRDVHLTKMPRMAVFVGANGSGKSTLLDVFAFLQDSVRNGVDVACQRRGGLEEVFSRDSHEAMLIELEFRLDLDSPRLTYAIEIDRYYDYPKVAAESLSEWSANGKDLFVHMVFRERKGFVVKDVVRKRGKISGTPDDYELSGIDDLALETLGRLRAYPLLAAVRERIEAWRCTTALGQLSGNARSDPTRESLDLNGSNVTEFAQYLQREHRGRYDAVVRRLSSYVPGLKSVEPVEMRDGWTDLRFKDAAFHIPFAFDAVSEGTRKLFSILIRLNEPVVHPMLTIEEPENDLYPAVMWPLAEEFREYADRGSQVLISTHSPDFVNALNLDEVYWMEKRDGFAQIIRAQDDMNVASQHQGGALMGSLWTEGFFGKAHPR